LAALTIVFLLVAVTLLPFSLYSVEAAGHGTPITLTTLVALLVCLIPTTIGGLLSAVGIAGMDRMIQANVIAIPVVLWSGRRRRRIAPGQDGYHHPGQPPGDGFFAFGWSRRARAGCCSAARLIGR
jgi:hypothetical protein